MASSPKRVTRTRRWASRHPEAHGPKSSRPGDFAWTLGTCCPKWWERGSGCGDSRHLRLKLSGDGYTGLPLVESRIESAGGTASFRPTTHPMVLRRT